MLVSSVQEVLRNLYSQDVAEGQIQLQKTRKDFEGDVTLVVFPLLRISKKGPEQTGEEIGEELVKNVDAVERIGVVLVFNFGLGARVRFAPMAGNGKLS